VKSLRDTGYFLDAEALQSNYFDEYSENRLIILRKSLFWLHILSKNLGDNIFLPIYITKGRRSNVEFFKAYLKVKNPKLWAFLALNYYFWGSQNLEKLNFSLKIDKN
jgi:hypothetical protein